MAGLLKLIINMRYFIRLIINSGNNNAEMLIINMRYFIREL